MKKANRAERLFEIVFFRIFDVGRAVSLERLGPGIAAAGDAARPAPRNAPFYRDTPASLSLPQPLVMPLGSAASEGFGDFRAEAKIYEDGAITLCLRGRHRVRLETLGAVVTNAVIRDSARILTLSEWADLLFASVVERIRAHIDDPASDPGKDFETYIAFCLLENDSSPEAYVEENRAAIATLLMDSETGDAVHEHKIVETLAKPFSYTTTDLAVFDLDRCFIIDPREGYEDILSIIEHANYRLLELRVLDRLLDKRLDVAERDLSSFTRGGRASGGSVRKKFARIQSLRFVALFVLENLENSSKIIGDYYLGQIYERLCAMFNTDGWSRSVERRLDVLTSIYEMVKTDNAERRTLVLEIVFIAVCIILPLLQIWQALL